MHIEFSQCERPRAHQHVYWRVREECSGNISKGMYMYWLVSWQTFIILIFNGHIYLQPDTPNRSHRSQLAFSSSGHFINLLGKLILRSSELFGNETTHLIRITKLAKYWFSHLMMHTFFNCFTGKGSKAMCCVFWWTWCISPC